MDSRCHYCLYMDTTYHSPMALQAVTSWAWFEEVERVQDQPLVHRWYTATSRLSSAVYSKCWQVQERVMLKRSGFRVYEERFGHNYIHLNILYYPLTNPITPYYQHDETTWRKTLLRTHGVATVRSAQKHRIVPPSPQQYHLVEQCWWHPGLFHQALRNTTRWSTYIYI